MKAKTLAERFMIAVAAREALLAALADLDGRYDGDPRAQGPIAEASWKLYATVAQATMGELAHAIDASPNAPSFPLPTLSTGENN